jgi:hypothetical protein
MFAITHLKYKVCANNLEVEHYQASNRVVNSQDNNQEVNSLDNNRVVNSQD